ncbi:MAG: 50S ribosomal protein L11 methyltransferase [Bdellovibrionia bacterium]
MSFINLTQRTLKIAPQVLLYEVGKPLMECPETWISLPQLPGAVFGDGTHPTTRLCAGAVDFLCRQEVFLSVLDVGTGTGVLARIARARGAQFVAGTDIDSAALSAAMKNVALDSHPVKISILNVAPDHWGPRFNLVVANILEGPLRELAPKLSQALAPGGVLLLSGFTQLQIPGLQLAFVSQGLIYVNDSHLEEWALLMFRQKS